MPVSFNNSGKPAYMYESSGETWYAIGAKIDTASAYEWTNTQTYLNTATFSDAVNMLDGFNNFLNPAARDAAITSPVHGTICFVRQDGSGNPLNQIQYYSGSAWTANDGDISGVTAGTGLSGGGTAGTITLSVDTAVVATTNNTLTMTNKTLTSPVISTISNTGTLTLPTSTDTIVGRATTDTLTNKSISGSSNTITNVSLTTGVTGTLPVANGGTGITSLGTGVATFLGTPSSANLLAAVTDETGTGSLVFATSPTLVTPNIGVASGTSLTLTGDLILNGTNYVGSVQDELTLILMGAL